MIQLNEQGLKNGRNEWEEAGYQLPQYDHEAMVRVTRENPYWITLVQAIFSGHFRQML